MSDIHTVERIGDKWQVNFKKRCFSRDFESENDVNIVIAADLVYYEAEKVAASPLEIGSAKRKEHAEALQKAAQSLKQLKMEDTVREFENLADKLESKNTEMT